MNYNKLEIKQTNFQRNWKLELKKKTPTLVDVWISL